MADENQAQESEQEQEQIQEEEPVREPAEEKQDKPAKQKEDNGGLLMPILYALLAAVGAFTLVMIIGIVVTFITRPAEPLESPSAEPSSQVAQTQSPEASGNESPNLDDAS